MILIGVGNGHQLSPWREFNGIKVEEETGNMAVWSGGSWQNWSAISLSETSTVAVFEAMVNQIAGKAQQS